MTETPGPDSADDATTAEPDRPADPTATPQRRSLFSNLNRTNRIAAVALGGIATMFVAALLFGAGVLVGAEHGESRADNHASEGYDRGDGEREESTDSRGDDGSKGDGERDDADETGADDDRGEPHESSRSGAPDRPAPSQPNGPPRP